MARPSKPYAVLKTEKKSHITKAELQMRKQGEEALLTKEPMQEREEVRQNTVAHREFVRLNDLMCILGKNDALYEPIINRYCEIQGELADLMKRRNMLYGTLDMLTEDYKQLKEEMDAEQRAEMLYGFTEKLARAIGSVNSVDKNIKDKRKQLFDIEKECCMTIAAALRTVQKTPEKKSNALLEALGSD